mmetsp:Transcript_91979/g.259864  ORF Transcript_91979/g.259864 Transcript_91979/m.259864 type:complete len:288 (-) Transcript_91979:493-1356(-)
MAQERIEEGASRRKVELHGNQLRQLERRRSRDASCHAAQTNIKANQRGSLARDRLVLSQAAEDLLEQLEHDLVALEASVMQLLGASARRIQRPYRLVARIPHTRAARAEGDDPTEGADAPKPRGDLQQVHARGVPFEGLQRSLHKATKADVIHGRGPSAHRAARGDEALLHDVQQLERLLQLEVRRAEEAGATGVQLAARDDSAAHELLQHAASLGLAHEVPECELCETNQDLFRKRHCSQCVRTAGDELKERERLQRRRNDVHKAAKQRRLRVLLPRRPSACTASI